MPLDLVPFSHDYPVIGSREPDAITLGRRIERDYGVTNRMRYGGDQHILVLGQNGKGKGTRLLMPNLLQMRGNRSIVVVDPKGELAAVTAEFRRKVSRVIVINPFNVVRGDFDGFDDLESVGFNPLLALDPALPSFNARASSLADSLVTIEGKDPHWGQSARALIAALIMYTVIEARELKQAPKMSRFRELLCELSDGPHAGNDFEGAGLPKRAGEMMKSSFAGLRHKASQFTDWNREIQSIVSTARIQTEPFDDVEIAADLEQDGFDFRELRSEPTTVYLILPPEMMERHSKWLRLILTSAVLGVLKVRKASEPRVLFMIDEFFAMGRLQVLETVWSLVRGYGISLMPMLQDIEQLQKLYPDLWQTFMGSAGAVVNFGPNDMKTAEYLSRRAGNTTRHATSSSSSHSINSGTSSGWSPGGGNTGSSSGTSFSTNTNTSPVQAPLMAAHDFLGLDRGSVVITLDGVSNIIPAYAPAYYEIRQCVERARANPYYTG